MSEEHAWPMHTDHKLSQTSLGFYDNGRHDNSAPVFADSSDRTNGTQLSTPPPPCPRLDTPPMNTQTQPFRNQSRFSRGIPMQVPCTWVAQTSRRPAPPRVRKLVGALSPVNHKGLYQGYGVQNNNSNNNIFVKRELLAWKQSSARCKKYKLHPR